MSDSEYSDNDDVSYNENDIVDEEGEEVGETEQDVQDIETVQTLLEDIKDIDKKIKELVKDRSKLYDRIDVIHRRELNAEFKRGRKIRRDARNALKAGFNASRQVPDEICDALGFDKQTMMSRPQLIKLTWKYIHEHKLYDKRLKIIKSDKNLKQLFELEQDDILTMKNLQTYITKIYHRYVFNKEGIITGKFVKKEVPVVEDSELEQSDSDAEVLTKKTRRRRKVK